MSQIVIHLDSMWVLERSGDATLPAEAISNFVQSKKMGSVVQQDFTELVVAIDPNFQFEVRAFQNQLVAHLCEVYKLTVQEVSAAVTVSEKAEAAGDTPKTSREKLTDAPVPEPKEPAVAVRTELVEPEKPQTSVMDEIRGLHGAEQFIALCEGIRKTAPVFRQRNLQPICTSICYLFSMDKGCGYTTSLQLLSKLMQEEALLSVKREPQEIVLDPEGTNKDALSNAARVISNCANRVVGVDISNWCDKVSAPEFRDFLLNMQSLKKEAVYVFRLPYLEHSVLERIEEALSDVMRVQKVVFPPMSATALQEISRKKLEEKGFTATPEAWELFQLRLAEEKSDGRFYGIRTAEKILEDMIFLKVQVLAAGESKEENCISAEDLATLTDDPKQNLSAEEMLNRLVGVDKLREKIYEFINQIEFAKKTSGVSAPSMHMRFIGNPGTGKTTIARILGKLLKERGLLSKGYFFEHAGGDFIGMYVGHTAPKTLALCRDAYGSVLFIDEAYTLANANYRDGSGYAKEAIDTLIAQMENHRDDMVVIMAGYPQDMERLMVLNQGLPGRMPFVLEFPNYTRQELFAIFLRMVENSAFTLTSDAEAAAQAYFENLDERILAAKDFSNARFARNLFERTWSKTVTRSQFDGGDIHVITKADFDAAVVENGQPEETKTTRRTRPGYHLGI